MADDPETSERRWKWREVNIAAMFGGVLFMALMIAAFLGVLLLVTPTSVPTLDPGQETTKALE